MAIAPLEDRGERQPARRHGEAGRVTPLRALPGGRPPGAPARRAARHARPELDVALDRARAAHPSSRVAPSRRDLPTGALAARPGTTIARADPRDASDAARARRRRAGGLAVLLVALALLAMPLRALGAVTVLGQPTPAGVPAGLAPGTRYVVQPGDTLRSIAWRVNPASVASIAAALARESGSSRVVPGERLVIPDA